VVIWAALCVGVATFFAISFAVEVKPDSGLLQPILAAAAVLAIGCISGSRLWPARIKQAAGATPEQMALTRHIVGCALCEGAALFAVVAILLTRSPYAIAIAAICFYALLTLYPSLERWNRLARLGEP